MFDAFSCLLTFSCQFTFAQPKFTENGRFPREFPSCVTLSRLSALLQFIDPRCFFQHRLQTRFLFLLRAEGKRFWKLTQPGNLSDISGHDQRDMIFLCLPTKHADIFALQGPLLNGELVNSSHLLIVQSASSKMDYHVIKSLF